jgi:tRNA modification GTPase
MADLVLWLTDASADSAAAGRAVADNLSAAEIWALRNKGDLLGGETHERSESQSINESRTAFAISALTGAGMEPLVKALAECVRQFFSTTEAPMVTRARHRRALEETITALDRAVAQGATGSEELIAEDLGSAATALGRLTGRVDVEDILDVIFREFCIGK